MSEADVEAQADQALAELLGMDAPPALEAPPSPAPEQPAEPSAPGQEQGEPAGQVVSGTPAAEDPKLERARTALKRSGFLDTELDALDSDTLLARGLKRADALAAEQDTYRRLRELESRLEDSNGKDTTTEEQAEARDLVAEYKAALEPLGQALADEGEAVGPLAEKFAGLAERLDQIEQQVKAPVAKLEEIRQREEADLVSASRGRVGERFPGLRDDALFADESPFAKTMAALAQSGRFNDPGMSVAERVDALLTATARAEGLGEADTPEPVKQPPAAKRKADFGSPLSPATNTPSKSLTDDEKARLAFDMGEAGKSEEEIRRAIG